MRILITSLIIFIMLFGLTSPVVAEQPETITLKCDGENIDHNVQKTLEIYNNNTNKIPDVIKPALSANTTDFSIENSTVSNYTVNTDSDLKITGISTDSPNNPDVVVSTNRSVACNLSNSDTPVQTFQDAYDNGDINIEGYGIVNEAKVYVIELINSFV